MVRLRGVVGPKKPARGNEVKLLLVLVTRVILSPLGKSLESWILPLLNWLVLVLDHFCFLVDDVSQL